MKLIFKLIMTSLLFIPLSVYGYNQKEPCTTFQKDSTEKIYIPKDIHDSFNQINSFLPDSLKQEIKKTDEKDFVGNAHFGLGMWMRNNWQLWGGSRLSKYFNNLGIYHPDDMSGIILHSYHRYLQGNDIRLKKQVNYYKKYWGKIKKEEEKKMKAEMSLLNKGDTLVYNYPHGFSSQKQEEDYYEDICIAKGIIVKKDRKMRQILIRLIEDCNNNGIIASYTNEKRFTQYANDYDDNGNVIIDENHEVHFMKEGEILWFYYDDWESNYK